MTDNPEPNSHREQNTIRRPADVSGIGFFTAADVTVRFLPAPPDHGIAFQRIDLPASDPIPALIEYTVPRQRRTAVEYHGATVEMTEHVLAALAGLQIDNCLVQINGPEPPGVDGSSAPFVEALLEAEITGQGTLRRRLRIEKAVTVRAEDGRSEITARPAPHGDLALEYRLDYGARSPVPAQEYAIRVSRQSFLSELAFARTFVLEAEVDALRKQGYGRRTTAADLLVFADDGTVIGNQLRAGDECARHKLLDCLGDFALLGCDLAGTVTASRSGHRLNRELVRRLIKAHPQIRPSATRRAA